MDRFRDERRLQSLLERTEDALAFADGIIDTVQLSLLVLDADLRVVTANRTFYETFRVERAATEGRLIYELGGGQWNIPELERALEQVIPADEAFRGYQVRHRFESIGERVMSLSGRRITRESGHRPLLVLSIEDITERDAAQRRLRESETQYRELVESINSIIVKADTAGRITFVNPFTEKLLGVDREELVGQPVFGRVIPCPAEQGADMLRRILDDPEPFYINESVMERPDGSVLFFSWSATLVRDDSGAVIELLIDGNDLSPTKASRKRLDDALHLLDESPDAVALLEPDGTPVFLNRGFARTVGLPAETKNHPSLAELASGSEIAADLLHLFERTRDSAVPQDCELRADRAELQWLARPDLDDAGQVVRAVMLFGRDVSDLKRIQREFERATARAEASRAEAERVSGALRDRNAELDAFNYSVSHDLRAPLRAMIGFASALCEDYGAALDETAQDYLRRIDNGARRMSALIEGLLTLSRVGREAAVIERVDLSALARAVAEELRSGEPHRGVAFDIADGLTADADPRLTRIVFDNLFGNAWKFTVRVRDPTIAFGCTERDGEATYFVRDNGAGFDEGHARDLFIPFKRLHTEREFAGSGIGLATVARVIRNHGGRIWAESRPGQGATFWFTLGAAH